MITRKVEIFTRVRERERESERTWEKGREEGERERVSFLIIIYIYYIRGPIISFFFTYI